MEATLQERQHTRPHVLLGSGVQTWLATVYQVSPQELVLYIGAQWRVRWLQQVSSTGVNLHGAVRVARFAYESCGLERKPAVDTLIVSTVND